MALRHDTASSNAAPDVDSPRVRTTITLPRELHQRVRVAAIQSDVSMEAWIEAAIVARLKAETSR